MQNRVAITAVKVTPSQNIEYINPSKREGYFGHERPANQPLVAFNDYSQVRYRVVHQV